MSLKIKSFILKKQKRQKCYLKKSHQKIDEYVSQQNKEVLKSVDHIELKIIAI